MIGIINTGPLALAEFESIRPGDVALTRHNEGLVWLHVVENVRGYIVGRAIETAAGLFDGAACDCSWGVVVSILSPLPGKRFR